MLLLHIINIKLFYEDYTGHDYLEWTKESFPYPGEEPVELVVQGDGGPPLHRVVSLGESLLQAIDGRLPAGRTHLKYMGLTWLRVYRTTYMYSVHPDRLNYIAYFMPQLTFLM